MYGGRTAIHIGCHRYGDYRAQARAAGVVLDDSATHGDVDDGAAYAL